MKEKMGAGRVLCSAALIVLLALSGYMGTAREEEVRLVSVPVVFETLDHAALNLGEEEDAQERLDQERERALMLLEDVIRDPKATQAAVSVALEQKMDIAQRMEAEARVEQMLEKMGFCGMSVFCGEQMTSVIAPRGAQLDEQARVQIVDAVASGTSHGADRIKIIQQKNE